MDTTEPKKAENGDAAAEPKKEEEPATNGDKGDGDEGSGTKAEELEQVKEETSEDKEDSKKETSEDKEDSKKEEEEKPDTEAKQEEEEEEKPPPAKDVKDEEAKSEDAEMKDVEKSPADDKKRKAEDEEPKDGKRKRKSAQTFQPEDFSQTKASLNIKKGRGDKLRDIPGVKESIESYSINDEILAHAYRFMFVTRGRLPKAEAKQLMLDYSGYLPEIDEKEDKAKIEEHDEELETKFSTRAYKMTIPQIKAMCDLFDVDRSPGPEEKVDKDVMIDRLLDFLSAPDAQYTNAFAKEHKKAVKKKKTSSPSPKKSAAKKKAATKDKDEASDEEEVEKASADEEEGGDMPSDSQLRKWVKCYVGCYNMNKATLKSALEVCSSKFGVDMTPKKKTIKMMLTEEC